MRQGTAPYNWAMGLGRFLNFDQLAARFNQWIGATAMADRAAPGDTVYPRDPSAVVAVLGEIEREYGDSGARSENEDLPPLNLERLKNDEARAQGDQ